jgi:hypothetical protein
MDRRSAARYSIASHRGDPRPGVCWSAHPAGATRNTITAAAVAALRRMAARPTSRNLGQPGQLRACAPLLRCRNVASQDSRTATALSWRARQDLNLRPTDQKGGTADRSGPSSRYCSVLRRGSRFHSVITGLKFAPGFVPRCPHGSVSDDGTPRRQPDCRYNCALRRLGPRAQEQSAGWRRAARTRLSFKCCAVAGGVLGAVSAPCRAQPTELNEPEQCFPP